MGNKAEKIQYMVIDVDGTMTDAGIYYDEHGNEIKKFCTRDAAGFFAAHAAGIATIVLTGRECQATARRMQEMRVDYLVQSQKDKMRYLLGFMQEHQAKWEEIAYLGDDLNDLAGMRMAGFAGCPADACEEIKAVCDYVSLARGGFGAVRDIISHLLKLRGEWESAIEKVYGSGV